MKKSLSVILGIVLIFSVVACGNSTDSKSENNVSTAETKEDADTEGTQDIDYGPAVSLNMGSTSAAEDIVTQGMKKVVDLVGERSNGKIKINMFPTSQLGTAVDQIEMLSQGALDMFVEGGTYMGSYGVTDNNILSLPFVIDSKEHYKNLMNSEISNGWEKQFLELNNIRTLAHNWYRNPVVITSKTPVYSIDDVQGMKVRVPQLEMNITGWAETGANPTAVAYNEVLLSLQQGVLDSTTVVLDAAYSMGFYEVAEYTSMVNSSYDSIYIWMNETKHQSLTEAQRQLITETVNEVGDWYSEEAERIADMNMKKMADSGNTIIEISDEQHQEFVDAVSDLAYEYEDNGTWSEGLYDKIRGLK